LCSSLAILSFTWSWYEAQTVSSHSALRFFATLISALLQVINKVIEWIMCDGVPYQKQEITLEFLVDLFRLPWFMAELYINYDCDPNCTDLFEKIAMFLYKNSYPPDGALYTTHVLTLDGLLAIVQAIADRARGASLTHHRGTPIDAELVRRRKVCTCVHFACCWRMVCCWLTVCTCVHFACVGSWFAAFAPLCRPSSGTCCRVRRNSTSAKRIRTCRVLGCCRHRSRRTRLHAFSEPLPTSTRQLWARCWEVLRWGVLLLLLLLLLLL
jgi:hypothetical protein